jgi:hypothetical protein
MLFDATYGTETFGRHDVKTSEDTGDTTTWGYSAINQDFFREIMRSVPRPLAEYTFVDVGSGKGAAVLMASEFGFRRLVGVELAEELVRIAKLNTEPGTICTHRDSGSRFVSHRTGASTVGREGERVETPSRGADHSLANDRIHQGLTTWYGLCPDAHRNPQDPRGALHFHCPLSQW